MTVPVRPRPSPKIAGTMSVDRPPPYGGTTLVPFPGTVGNQAASPKIAGTFAAFDAQA